MISSRHYVAISPWAALATVISWGLTVAVVINLLGGTFDERSCQTGCVQNLAVSSFLVALAGVLVGHRPPRHSITILCLLAMLALIGIYLTVFFIGVLFS